MRDLNKEPLKLGILGCGSFIQRRILPASHEVNHIKITAIYKRDREEANKIAHLHGIDFVASSEEELISHKDVEMVFIGSSNRYHERQALAVAAHDKPLLCEKPLAPTSQSILKMLHAFEEKKLLFLVGHSLRFKPAVQLAKEMVLQGKLGKIISIRARFSLPLASTNWRFQKDEGGGVLQDIGIHLIDLVRFITQQEVTSVVAMANYNEVDVTTMATLRLSENTLALIEGSFEQPFHSGFEIIGSKGQLISQNSLRQTYDPIETLCFIDESDTKTFYPLKASNVFIEELSHVAKAFNGEVKPLIPASEGFKNTQVVDAIELATKERKEIMLKDIC